MRHTSIIPVLALLATAHSMLGQKLSDPFAVQAIITMRMVQAEVGEYEQAPDGSFLVPRATGEALNSLDAVASTKDEVAVVRTLQDAFHARLSHNTTLDTLGHLAKAALYDCHDCYRGPVQVQELVSRSPTVLSIRVKETACFEVLEAVLRARDYHDPPQCSEAVLAVTAPDTMDVPVSNGVRMVPR